MKVLKLYAFQVRVHNLFTSLSKSSARRGFVETLEIEGLWDGIFFVSGDPNTRLVHLITEMIANLPNLMTLTFLQQDDLQYCDARVADCDDKKATETDRVPSSPPHLACFTGSSKWLKWLPNRSRQTISELVLVDNDPDWTAGSLETLVADLSDFTGLESLHVQAGSGALNDRLSPSAAMAFVSERVSWLKELTLCYYDHCPCLSLAMEDLYPSAKPHFPALVSLRIRVFEPYSLSVCRGSHVVRTGAITASIRVVGEVCPKLERCTLIGGCGDDLKWVRTNGLGKKNTLELEKSEKRDEDILQAAFLRSLGFAPRTIH